MELRKAILGFLKEDLSEEGTVGTQAYWLLASLAEYAREEELFKWFYEQICSSDESKAIRLLGKENGKALAEAM